jgi:hypothetical protein
VPEAVEQATLEHALAHPCHGPVRVAQELVLRSIQVSPGGVRGVWRRHGLLTKHERLLRLEKATAKRQISLTDEQVRLLERFSPEFRERHIEAPHIGSLVAVDTFFVGVLKGVGKSLPSRLTRGSTCRPRSTAPAATPGPGSTPTSCRSPPCSCSTRSLPTFDQHDARIEAVLGDNGREFCGRPDQYPYELFLQLEGIEHKRTRVSRPQSNSIVERLHRTLLDEYFRVEGRKTWFATIDEMQTALDTYLAGYNASQGVPRRCSQTR